MAAYDPFNTWIRFEDIIVGTDPDANVDTLKFLEENRSTLTQYCTINGERTSCNNVCNDYDHLFGDDKSLNLATCGAWSKLQAYWTYTGDYRHEDFAFFQLLGLNETDLRYADEVRGILTRCFQGIHKNYISSSPNGWDTTPTVCDFQSAFHNVTLHDGRTISTTDADLRNCVSSICTPTNIYPDIGGVGVSSVGPMNSVRVT